MSCRRIGVRRFIVAAGAAIVFCHGAAQAAGTSIPLGTVTGGVAVYYNATGPEAPSNQAYVRAQFSQANANGAEFNFDSTPIPGTGGLVSWYSIFQVVPNQFGLDLVLTAPTSDSSVPTPVLTAYDNVDGSIANRAAAGPVTWAIDSYTGPSNGPANPANQVVNSLLRGGTGANDGVTLTMGPPSQVGNLFTVAVSGELQSDDLVHWYTVASGTSPISNLQLTGKVLFSGSLTYDSTGDTGTDGVDFYAGTMILSAEVICGARFVATTGADSFPGPQFNSCRVPGTPCKTVQHAVDVACPGDTVN
ncbi:MAG: hypothetical protein ACHQNA_11940, partial [Acidimicrobiales bacterium]